MAVDMTNVPPWKQAILERKKKQDDDDRVKKTEELSRFSQMPSWKRDILLKKQQKQTVNGKVYLDNNVDQCNNVNEDRTPLGAVTINVSHSEGMPEKKLSPLCPTAEFDYAVLSKEDEDQEHLLPIQQNFWLKSDPKKAGYTQVAAQQSTKINHNHVQESNSDNNSSGNTSLNSSAEFESAVTVSRSTTKSGEDDDVFTNGEEVAYGRGFVNKLLKKFKHLSSPDDRNTLPRKSPSPFSKRNYSADTLLESPSKSDNRSSWAGNGGYATLDRCERLHSSPGFASSKERARSMDNLLSPSDESVSLRVQLDQDAELSSSVSVDNLKNTELTERPQSPTSKDNEVEELPKANIVSFTRNVFENISQAVPESSSPRSKEPSSDSVVKGSSLVVTPSESTRVMVNGRVSLVNGGSERVNSPRSTPDEKPTGQSRYFSSSKKAPVKKSSSDSNIAPKADINANRAVESVSQKNGGVHIRTSIPSEPLVRSSNKLSEPILNQNNNTVFSSKDKTDSSSEVASSWNSNNKRRAPVNPEKTQTQSDVKKPLNVTSVQVNAHLSSEDSPPPVAPPRTNSRSEKSVEPAAPIKEAKKQDAQRPNLNLNELQPKKNVVERKENNFHKPRQSNTVSRENKKNRKVDPSAGPGSLLIRPASNLVIGSAKTEYLQLTKYNDIKTGEFAPAKKRPGYYDTYSDDEDDYEEVPVTNIDDYLGNGDIPVTNIDDFDTEGGYIPREGDASHHRTTKVSKKWDFIGAGVRVGKSSLSKKTGQKVQKLSITFSDGAHATFEYPSEQSLLEAMPAQPGDFDHPETLRNMAPSSPDIEDMPDMDEPTASLMSTPGLGSGSLSSYKTKTSMEYEWGSQQEQPPPSPVPKPERTPSPETITPSDEDATWSGTNSSDMLF